MSLRDLVLHVGGYQNADQSTAQAETDAAEAVYQLRSGVAVERLGCFGALPGALHGLLGRSSDAV